MAIGAFAGGIFVDDDLLAGGCVRLNVALGAGNFGVAAGQRKVRFRFVVECGGSPALGVVAIGAMGLVVFGEELIGVGILVTGLALRGSALKT